MESEIPTNDPRVDFVADFINRSLRLKPDKWAKMYSSETNVNMINDFLNIPDCQTLIILINIGSSALTPTLEWPPHLKGSRAFYFIKKNKEALPRIYKLMPYLTYGDVISSPIDQLFSFVEEVLFPLLSNKMNQSSWPHVVVKDVARQVSAMKNKVYVITGQVKGKTLLPPPVGTEKLDESLLNFTNKNLIHSIETVLIEWSHQIHDELKKDSAQPLLDGLFPLPYVEFEFWRVKSNNLECIYDQLQSGKMKLFADCLEKANSSYFVTFKSLFQDVVASMVEAQDIYLYLKPLQSLLEDIESKSFEDIRISYHVLMHAICLIWTNSSYYNKSERIIVLMQEICNFLISMCRSYLDANDIFKGEVDENLLKIQTAVSNLLYFKEVFKHYQTELKSYFKDDVIREWDFSTQLIFHQYDKFISRVELLKNFFENVIELLKLEKIDYSGLKGKILNADTMSLFKEINELLKIFQEVTYDTLDLTDDSFVNDYEHFRKSVIDLDRKLATIACQAFDDCGCLESCFKLCTIFGSLLNRSLVHNQFDGNYPRLLDMMEMELFNVKTMYEKQMNHFNSTGYFLLHKNKPPVAGFIEWCYELKERLERVINLFQFINHPCLNSTDAENMYEHYLKMLELLKIMEESVYTNWSNVVEEICNESLAYSLIVRNPTTLLIKTNFSPKLVSVLREMKYLMSQGREHLPEKAMAVYKFKEELLQYWANLDLICSWYNKIRNTILEIEFPIIESELHQLDRELLKAEKELNWSSPETMSYTQAMKVASHDFEMRLQSSKDNIEQIRKIMSTWSKVPLFDRYDEKASSLLSFKDGDERMRKRYAEIKEAGDKIHTLLEANCSFLKANQESETWMAYVDYVDEIVADGFFNIIMCSLKFLVENTENRPGIEPLFETTLDLIPPDMVFKPAMQFGVADGFYDMIDGLAGDIYRQAAKIKRISNNEHHPNYQPQMEDLKELTTMRTELMTHVTDIMTKSMQYMESFDSYHSLWVDERHEFMRQFLLYGHTLTQEEVSAYGDDPIPETPPSLKQFEEQISSHENLLREVERMETIVVVEGWFRIDARPFFSGVIKEVKKWIKMFQHHLVDHVVNKLDSLEKFTVEVNQGLNKKLEEGDIDGLLEVMSYLSKVKDRQQKTDEMFEPLKHIIELLKQYQEELPENVHAQIQELPESWSNIKKNAVVVKQQIAPLIANEVILLKKNVALFDIKQQEFREEFKKIKAFYFDCPNPYQQIDEVNLSLTEHESELAELVTLGGMFEVTIPDFKQLKQCHKEIVMLKNLWDYTYVISNSIEFWTRTTWKNINIEYMETECKKFGKDLKNLDKEMRSWDTYIGTENLVKNLLTSLKSVTELQNSAIRDRHWMELMQTTGVRFNLTESTTLADLLSLNLHEYEEEVKNIVDKAVKEMSMEKILHELNNNWAVMEFEHEIHQRTKVTLLKANEETLEIMADNQVQLQNMLSSKYIAHFLEEVSEWQQKLSTADQVITIWMEVQKTWMHLESIFIGSEDIRKQLPEDTMRFDVIDSDFKALIKEIEGTKNIVEATNKPNLYPKLEALQIQLTICEKALSNYLETKRLAFPRFYFVSSVDLLDILSNGNNPSAVARHLTKLFDSMAKLTFELDGDGNPTKRALGMSSKDGEYMTLSPHPCDCDGQVETWLMKLLIIHCQSVKHEITEAVASYEEKPREVWVFEPPAQPALVTVQIWWSTEVNMAFQRLEEGYENALKEFNKKQISQLNSLITLLVGKLSEGERQKIMTICTIEVHNRDVVAKLIAQKIENAQAFAWLSQLRHRWDDKEKDCFANICDAQFKYMHEYLGNTPRLVITPLTDRCYITLTQSLHLMMSGAPAGPAGTGKTETTKDLGRALGIMVYVFNCSEQLDCKSIGNIYKGLAQSGAWGCFDEFNRISVEVLSVVAVQVKSIQDAIRDKKKTFNFIGETISLIPTVGIFITMNPGYAGRTELPENLKALFRPCAMVVPDFELICEIMLVAEGFLNARLLSSKFITLYTLCKELLSKQDHYDWGLRAIKSVLVVAGKLKRGDLDRAEDQVLMRALRDFNIPKIVTDDLPVFMGLIGDLFPALDVPRKKDIDFEKKVKEAVLSLKLQAEDGFVLKVVQLQELFDVRHSVFIVGNAGTGKSMVWKSLFKTNQNLKKKPVAVDLDPKAVTNDELFGVINPSTREWKDGLFSVVMRDLAYQTYDGPKWIVLDGDIDPMWIESLNTVMDDNKILTLASNERIPLTPSMRLLFEISHLKTATPATVSRAGILYINPQDLGWSPYITSWVDTRENQTERVNLLILFDKYIPVMLDTMKSKFKKITPVVDLCHLQMLIKLLECMLTPENVPPDCPKEWYEIYFVFCLIWAFGGCLFQDQLVDHRVEFSKWWVAEFKAVKFPNTGTVFDYYVDSETKKFEPWSKKIKTFQLVPDVSLKSVLVDTNETATINFFLDLLINIKIPVMLIGNAGTGKSVLMINKLGSLKEDYMVSNVPFNFYTTSEILQKVLEKPLEKKAGRNYGPRGGKKLIYFIDDMNMPEVDKYFTVQPHTIIRQHMNYGHWYDRVKLTLKEIHNTQYVSCMNPTAGSFTIDARLQRHFAIFAMSFPGSEALQTIYNTMLSQHMISLGFDKLLQRYSTIIVNASLFLHSKVTQIFLPTAIKFHYIYNLRDMSNIFQGLLFSNLECVQSPTQLARLWIHECQRVYKDKLVDKDDNHLFDKILKEAASKYFEDIPSDDIFAKPLLFCHFATGVGDSKYMPVNKFVDLTKMVQDALENYNEVNSIMNLVLFEDAICHILRINRIIESPQGNALLIGVGGSGKQSLSRLAAFISSFEIFQVVVKKGYGINDLRADLATLCTKAGIKGLNMVFLMTDGQVLDEKFLVLINDLLASGEIPDLYADDEIDNIINLMRNEVKAAGMFDSRENCWKFFIDKIRNQLNVVLCFSPQGDSLRNRSRKFPAIINTTCIDWFHEWPREALVSVSRRFLGEIDLLTPDISDSVAEFMSQVHESVNEVSASYLMNEKRYNYTTPKSFLEQIALYKNLLTRKNSEIQQAILRLANGLEKLEGASGQVDELKSTLATQEVELAKKSEEANELISVIKDETEKVSAEKAIANEEEKKVKVINDEVGVKFQECQADLAKAQPALDASKAALDTLNKNNLTELKGFTSPPSAVVKVAAAVMVLMANESGKIPKDRSWKSAKTMMSKVDEFLNNLINYKKESIPPVCQRAVQPYLEDPEFEPEYIKTKSLAAAGLCAWVINIMKFYEVFCEVEPKRIALEEAQKLLSDAEQKLSHLRQTLAILQEKLSKLNSEFEIANAAKAKCQREADQTAKTIDLSNRLVLGLASENVRWRHSVETLQMQGGTIPGDILLVTAFISYVGCFTKPYRIELMEKHWLPYFKSLANPIPSSESLDMLTLLCDDAQLAKWQNEGLPNDRMSSENATIFTNAERWPLLIDPQLQGMKWIKRKYGDKLIVVRLDQKTYVEKIEKAVADGSVVLIENIGESVDPILDPVIGRNTIKKGKVIKIGDKEISFNKSFKLILQTKLANPHYKPELQAQTTLINFTVTKDSLEDQLLAMVVAKEQPEQEMLKAELTRQQNEYKITLKYLEDSLLARLSEATGNFLGDYELVENLETTKRTSADVEEKVKEAKITEKKINEYRETYRLAGARGSLLYFILNDLNKIHPMYQFSLKAFGVVFEQALQRAEPAESVKQRLQNLIDCITLSVFTYTSRGLFEADKIIFMTQMTFQILLEANDMPLAELDFLLRFPVVPMPSPVDFLSAVSWGGVKTLSNMDEFKNLDRDIEGSSKRWKKFVESETPEQEKFPQEWKNKSTLQKLCMMRALRSDRMTYAIKIFVEEKLGKTFIDVRTTEFAKSYEESGPATPIFFILSPGVDPLKDVEKLGRALGFTFDNKNLHNISLGQGQEIVAENAMDIAAREGHWVILQNVHLVSKWLPTLEKKLEQYSEQSHSAYRVFISAEAASSRDSHIMPQGILESAIKITNEPPTGMHANLHKALDIFSQDTLDMCTKEVEFKSILFALCYFHAVVSERRKFGPQGWNRSYPFNAGDLTISVSVLYNYLEANAKVPWEDLRYLFGEIMYGGHITDDWDRRLCRTYLEEYMNPSMLEGELNFAPGFPSPPTLDYKSYHQYIDDILPSENPILYGLHPNAEIEFLSQISEVLFRSVLELQPREAGFGAAGGISREEKIKSILDDILDRLPEPFPMQELMAKVPPEERTPYVVVAFQECERMNILTMEIRRSLIELNLGIKGELTISSDMERLSNSLFMDNVPLTWAIKAYPSLYNLTPWYADLLLRTRELELWSATFQILGAVWLAGFFNPQSFLTAIMQQMARKNEWPLDKMSLQCDVLKKSREEIGGAPREGAYVCGLFMEGARWDIQLGVISEAKLKELAPPMPVIFIKAIPIDRQETKNIYECPVYKTKQRGPTFVWKFNLKSKDRPARWILGGVALLLQI